MSKSSPKQRYEQLMEWIETRGINKKRRKRSKKQSRLDYYKQKGI